MPDAKTQYSAYLKTALGEDRECAKAYTDFVAGKSHILMPITYFRSPNYLSLRALATAASLTRLGNKVSILLNDNNISSHKSVFKNSDTMYYLSSGRYIQQIIDQMMHIIAVFGGSLDDIKVVRASDLWARITTDYLQFIEFYRMLGKLRIYSKDFENGESEEAYLILERPFDAFAFDNYSSLTKSDFGNPDYLLLNNKNAESYRRAAAMLSRTGGAIDKRERILQMYLLPVLQHDDDYPSCYMSPSQIGKLLATINVSKLDASKMQESFIMPMLRLLSEIGSKPEQTSIGNRVESRSLAYDLYEVFSAVTVLLEASSETGETDLRVSSPIQAGNIRKLLASKRIVQVLRYCNGEYTIAEIAKKAGLQLSNASLYMNRLRESGLISADRHPRLLVSSIVFPMKTLIL